MADEEEAPADGGEGGGDDAYDPQRALVAQSLEVNKLRQHVEVLKRANERIRDQYKQEIRSLLQPLIERHRKLQLENGKLSEKIEKLSVAPPGSDEALVEELRKLRHDHGILQKITEGLESDSRLARRLQAELEEAQQRIEALDVRVADLDRERRRLEVLVAERDTARVELDEQLEKAQNEQREWKEKYDKAQQSHKDELRGYQQQLGEAIGRYKSLEKQHQDALFARDLLPILYEELQAEAATYDELTALFAGERGDPDAYYPATHEMAAPVVADAEFGAYQPSDEATIALAAGTVAAAQHELDEFGVGALAEDVAHAWPATEAAMGDADMVEALMDPLDDLPLDDTVTAIGTVGDGIPETGLDVAHLTPEAGDLQVMADDLGDLADVDDAAPLAAADGDGVTLTDLGFSDDEMAVLQDLTGSPAAEAWPAEAEGDALEPVLDEVAEAPFAATGFSFGDTPADSLAATEVDDLGAYLADEGLMAGVEPEPETAVVSSESLEVDDEPMVLGAVGFDEELAEQAAGVHSGLVHPLAEMPDMAIDDAATEAEVAERTLIDRETWDIDDGGEALTVGAVEAAADATDADDEVDFASQLAQSLGGFADTSDDDVEDVVWEDGPIDEVAEETHAGGGIVFAPGALEAPSPTVEADGDLAVAMPDFQAEDEEDQPEVAVAVGDDPGHAWPVGGVEAVEAADEMQPTSWGDALSAGDTSGSWAAAMTADAGGLKHSETSISAEDIARLLDDDDDLSAGTPPLADADSPEFRIQPPKLEPPSLP